MLYPNVVVDNVIHLLLPADLYRTDNLLTLNICDIEGRVIFTKHVVVPQNNDNPVSLTLPSAMPAAVYIVRVLYAGEFYTAKMIKY